MSISIAELIRKGGVYKDIEGENPKDIYKTFCNLIKLPETVSPETLYEALCSREEIMSTAVGNGIALPHARSPIMKKIEDQRISVIYLKKPIDMKAPDNIKVFVMFVLMTQNPQDHLKILSSLVKFFKETEFKKMLEANSDQNELLKVIEKYSSI